MHLTELAPAERGNPRLREEVRREESSSSKALVNPVERGIPLQREPLHLGKNAMEVALGEVRDTMLQYTKVADPTESAARQPTGESETS